MRFTIGGRQFRLDRDSIYQVTKNIPPKVFDGRNKYYVEIHGEKFPPKQIIHLATGLDYTDDFNAQEARRVLKKLGFIVHEISDDAGMDGLSTRVQPEASGGLPKFAITLEQDEDGYIIASCPALPGCHSQGKNEEEAIANIREAIRGYVASMRRHGEEIPNIKEVREIEVSV